MKSEAGDALKITAVIVLGVIAALALFPYASGERIRIEEPALYIALGSAVCIAVVILSDRLSSLKATRDSFELHLESVRGDLESTISEFRRVAPVDDPRINEAEELVVKSHGGDLRQEAEDIGKAMKMLRAVMREYQKG